MRPARAESTLLGPEKTTGLDENLVVVFLEPPSTAWKHTGSLKTLCGFVSRGFVGGCSGVFVVGCGLVVG